MLRFIKSMLILLGFLFAFPDASLAVSVSPLHDKPPGTIITFSGNQWMILDQKDDGTTYIILSSNDGDKAFDADNTQLFNPSDSNNIGYYLNNIFYNSLSQRDLIENHSWEIKYENGSGSQADVTCKISLISYAEYNAYRLLFPSDGSGYIWWTRTPRLGSPSRVWLVNASGGMGIDNAYIYKSRGVRPTLYLKPDLLVSDTNEVIGNEIFPPLDPANLVAGANAHDQVRLTWQANTEPDLAGYIIFRDYVEIDRVGAAETSYIDSGLRPNTTYIYGIKAYNTSNIESDMSNAATATTPHLPNPVLTARVDGQMIKMSWTGAADNFLVVVNGQQVDSITGNRYDYKAQPGSYALQVVALIGAEQYPSEPVQVKVAAFITPGSSMAGDVINNAGLVLYPAGGLLALALALKASPWVVTTVKAGLFKKFF
ncbi:hypothetical protein Psfp_02344 [Pelotomaculum sp. FP]|uniref:DUF6273 domain-containing protein n=1 Tax=Pelotomaculum sp. FP TaxID=261474 RepID=UPI0010669753|nr:DUF6273 domain-containing protein [Pelotomaculum sp. FP]TEB15168.1 hypothetical protein Psfp_02344 [Pelotomaculum sp. FP]